MAPILSSIALTVCLPLAAQNTPPAPVPAEAASASATPPAPASDPAAETAMDPESPDQLLRHGLDRYDKIIRKSPFAFKIVAETGPPPVSFAADLALAGFTIDSGKGVTYASVVDKKANNKRFVIRTDKPNEDGIQLVQLNRGQTLLESSVVARKGSEEATIKSDKQIIERKAVVNAAVVGQPAQANAGRPGQANNLNLNLNTARGGNVQQQINNQLQTPPQPGAAPQPGAQSGGLPPGVAPGGGGAVPTVGDQAIQAAQPQAQPGQGRGQRPGQAPGRRRVILPPSPQN
jgi:hypothetical protein